jgi:hypothetical protein
MSVSSASPVWSIVNSPNTLTLVDNTLDGGVACVSESDCWAVGSYDGADGRQTLTEHWDGNSWTIVPSPSPTGNGNKMLTGIACVSSADCWAVGRYFDFVGKTFTLHWDGSSWTLVPSLNVSSDSDSQFYGVTCASATECWAVGYYVDAGGNETLIERWDGSTWSIAGSPNPSSQSFANNILYGVACASATSCWAVGSGGSASQALIEHWDGTSWTIDSSPNLPTSSTLSAVTCVSASQCWAVGNISGGFGSATQTLIEQWNGTSWSVITSPNTSPTANNYLNGVACPSASDCWAVGSQNAGSGNQTLVERWNGTLWSIVTTPNPSATANIISGVACASSTFCWVTGSYYAGDNSDQTFAERWNGSSWTLVPTADIPPVPTNNLMWGVSCLSSSDCWTAGYYLAGFFFQTLIEHWNGTSWTIVDSPNANNTEDNVLYSVSCVSSSDCWAVGHYFNPGNTVTTLSVYQTLVEHWDGTSWDIVTSPNFSPNTNNGLESIACLSSSDCWAAGYYYQTASTSPNNVTVVALQTLVEHWDGTSWSIVTSPNTSPTDFNFLFGVTCASSSDCWAVGNTYNRSNDQTLVEHWDGTSWSITSSPNTTTTDDNDLSAVGCTSSGQCFAVGDHFDPNGQVYQTLIERWDGTSWTISNSPNASTTQHNLLLGVACVPNSQCWAVGIYFNNGLSTTLIEQWDGASWNLVSSPNTSAANPNYLYGTTCLSASQCWAVGVYIDDNGNGQTLTESLAVPVQLTSSASTKQHGNVGAFNIDLPLTGNPGIECRSGGANGDYTVIFTFADPLTNLAAANVTDGTGSVSAGNIDPKDAHNFIVNLTGVANAQTITVSLANVTDAAGHFSPSVPISMGVLLGDVNASRRVDAADVSLVRQQTLQPVTPSNFRTDVNASGRIDAADVSIVRQQTLTSLP